MSIIYAKNKWLIIISIFNDPLTMTQNGWLLKDNDLRNAQSQILYCLT